MKANTLQNILLAAIALELLYIARNVNDTANKQTSTAGNNPAAKNSTDDKEGIAKKTAPGGSIPPDPKRDPGN